MTPETTTAPAFTLPRTWWVAAAFTVTMIAGCLMTWASIFGIGFTGIQTGDGKTIFGFGFAALAGLTYDGFRQRIGRVDVGLLAAIGVVCGWLAVHGIYGISNVSAVLFGARVSPTVGPGLFLCAAGALGILGCCVAQWRSL